ncbi:MAG: ATP-grasp domain-containing protein [Calditrichaceae bacterium]|nr:ATP-grasp domain-containing protein [Calditrichia bacterium]NUQ42082.1 ATP-grasp domain-containing protein [Calditrichaceae bacterium]
MKKTFSERSQKALVLGVDDRSALTVTRSLGRRGVEVHLGIDQPYSIAQFSRYTRKVIRFPGAGRTPELWLEKLAEHLAREKYDLVIPTVDKYLVPVVQNRARLEKLAKFAIPDERGFRYTYDKRQTLELAESLGVPCPRSAEIHSPEGIERVIAEFGFPLILKPVSSKVWRDNLRYDLSVTLARDRAELGRKLPALLALCPVLIQTFHPGVGVGQEFLMKDGQALAVFQHERVHEPQKGGGSSYRKSVEIDPLLLSHSLKLLQALNWTGVAMVEYKYDKSTGAAVFMEINGRFWGSLPLAVAAGVDFPAWLFDMLVNDRLPQHVQYRKNLYVRNPVHDLDWLKENFRADKSNPFSLALPWRAVLGEAKNLLLFRERWDTIVWDDPQPGVRQLLSYLKKNLRGAADKLSRALIHFDYKFNLPGRWLRQRRIAKLLRRNPAVAFVCKGNICRSPFAGIYLKSLSAKHNLNHISGDSFGLIPRENRRSPGLALAAAESFGVDMSAHRSKMLTPENAAVAGVIFVMDIDLYKQVKRLYPGARRKLFFLGALQPGRAGSIEIADPYGKTLEQFKSVFAQITRSVDQLLKLAKNQMVL